MPAILFYLLLKNKKTTKRKIIKKIIKKLKAYITQKKADIRNKTKTSSKRVGNNFVFGVSGLNSLNKVEDNCIYIILFVENPPKK